MNIGDYVRTNKGIIGKLIKIYREHPYPTEWIIEVNTKKEVVLECDNHSVIKSSPNIIDLIEVGDYVNGFLIDNLSIGFNCEEFIETDMYLGGRKRILKSDINSIVTKKQFERMEYKI